MIEMLSNLAPWLFGAGGLFTGLSAVGVAIAKSRGDQKKAELSHDARVAPPLIKRVEKLEGRLDDCEKRHDECKDRVTESVEVAERAKERADDLEVKVKDLQAMVERRTEDLTGKFRTVAAEEIERAQQSTPPKPLKLPPPKKRDRQ